MRTWYALAAFDVTTGAIDTAWNPGANRAPRTISVSYAYVGGPTSVGGVVRRFAAAIDANTGAADPNWNPMPSSRVFNIVVVGERVYLSGEFVTMNGYQRRFLAAVDAVTGAVDEVWRPPAERLGGCRSQRPARGSTWADTSRTSTACPVRGSRL